MDLFKFCDGVKILTVHPHNGINARPDPVMANNQCFLEAWFQQRQHLTRPVAAAVVTAPAVAGTQAVAH